MDGVDEDGALDCFTALKSFIWDETNLNIETTGGYAPFLNGKLECPNYTLTEHACCMLLNDCIPVKDWCYDIEHTADIYWATLNSGLRCAPPILIVMVIPISSKTFTSGDVVFLSLIMTSRRRMTILLMVCFMVLPRTVVSSIGMTLH
jgi:hypothetical protein